MKINTNKKRIKRRTEIAIMIAISGVAFIGGMLVGMIIQQMLFTTQVVEIAEGLEGVTLNIEVDVNETLMVDRLTDNMKDIVWDMRKLQNCTKTEKGYCAIECYENNILTPCENFTSDEHFCNDGRCEANGICPTYYEILRGKTIEDCIKEVEEKQ